MFASTLARTEWIGDIALATINQAYTLPTQGGLIPNDRFMWGLRLTFEGRFTNPAAPNNPTAQEADAPFTILENIAVEGFHRIRGNNELFVNVRAADLREYVRLYSVHEPLCTVGGVQTTTLNLGDGATSDVRFVIDVPFVPLALPWRAQYNWLLDAPNYERLTLTITYADWLNVFTGGNAGTFSAIGGAGGNPRLIVEGLFAQAGPTRFAGYVPGRVYRYFREVVAGNVVTGGAQLRLFDIPKGYAIRGVILKTGTKSATVTAGNNAYATLIDTMLTNIVVNRGLNRLNRSYRSYFTLKEDICGINAFSTLRPNVGYAVIDWASRGFDAEVLETRALVAGPTGDVDLFIESDIVGGAAQGALMQVEEWRYRAATLLPPSARISPPIARLNAAGR